MKIVDAGHEYLLTVYDKVQGTPADQMMHLSFMKREGSGYPFNYGHHPGSNCQEVLRALIDRSRYLQCQQPCAETEAIISLLQTALLLFEQRAARLHGGALDVESMLQLCSIEPCAECGHVVCHGHGEAAQVVVPPFPLKLGPCAICGQPYEAHVDSSGVRIRGVGHLYV